MTEEVIKIIHEAIKTQNVYIKDKRDALNAEIDFFKEYNCLSIDAQNIESTIIDIIKIKNNKGYFSNEINTRKGMFVILKQILQNHLNKNFTNEEWHKYLVENDLLCKWENNNERIS